MQNLFKSFNYHLFFADFEHIFDTFCPFWNQFCNKSTKVLHKLRLCKAKVSYNAKHFQKIRGYDAK